MNDNPKILFWDTEVSRSVVEGYGPKWDYKVVKYVRQQQLMCYAYKWMGEKRIHYVSVHDFENYKDFVQSLANLLSEADVSVAHNGNRFDDPMSNTFFVTNGIHVPSPRKSVDTLQVARSKFRFPSNSLRDLGEYLGLGHKEDITYAELEDEFLSDHCPRRVERLMSKYVKKDVELLEKIYYVLRPYMSTHPNLAVLMRKPGVCPKCGNDKEPLIYHGERPYASGIYHRYECPVCSSWCRSRKRVDPISHVYVNQ